MTPPTIPPLMITAACGLTRPPGGEPDSVADVVKADQEVNVKILDVSPDSRKISLSIRQAIAEPAGLARIASGGSTRRSAARW